MGENWTFVKTPQQVLGDRKKKSFSRRYAKMRFHKRSV